MPSRPNPLSRARATSKTSPRFSGRFTAAGRRCARLCSLYALPRLFPDVFEAAAIGDLPNLQSILAATPSSASEFSPDGWTALHLAAGFGTPGAVAALLSAGADVNALSRSPRRTSRSMPPSHWGKTLTSSICCSRTAPR